MTQAIKAQGTELKVTIGGTPQTISEVLSLGGPTLSSDLIDVTNHSSPGAYKEFILGGKDGGEVSFDINYDPPHLTHNASTGLLAMYDAQSTEAFTLVFKSTPNYTWTFNGIIQDFQPNAEIGSQLTASVTVKVTGQPTLQ
jgi:hypothetical protein